MNSVYDILLNFNSEYYRFFEWEDSDIISHIKKICVYRVNDKVFDLIINNKIKVDKSFLDKINNKTEIYGDKSVKYITYSAIFGNELECIAIKFNKDGEEISRSDLILDEKEEVLELILNLNISDINVTCLKPIKISSISTRKEKNNIFIMKNELKKAYDLNDIGKLKYMYYELYGKYECNKNKIYNEILNDIKMEWSYKHDCLLSIVNILNTRKQI